MDKSQAIHILKKQITIIDDLLINRSNFKKWKRDTEIAIENIFGCNTRHINDFNNISYSNIFAGSFSYNASTGETSYSKKEREKKENEAFLNSLESAKSVLESFVQEIENYWSKQKTDNCKSFNGTIKKIELICHKFHQVSRQMRSRYNNRPTLEINDEYDVQDLFHSLLTLYFDDARPEESNPSHAGSNSRSDFLLKPEQTVIEIKTTIGKSDKINFSKKFGDELTLDISKYQTHPDCKTLVCFIYDPKGIISNPRGLERDLEKVTEKIEVKIFIRP